MRPHPANRSPETLAFIRKHFTLDGDDLFRDGRPVRQRSGAGKADYRKVHIRYREDGTKETWKLSRLKLFLATGAVPAAVDHKSGTTRDDRLSNLRAATCAQNSQNKRAKRNKRGGLPRGIEERSPGRFRARIGHGRRQIYVGTFATVEEAREARNAAEKPLKGAFHRPRTRRKLSVIPARRERRPTRNFNKPPRSGRTQ